MSTIVIMNISRGTMALIPTTEHERIYNLLIRYQFTHELAEDVASWAELALDNEEYDIGKSWMKIFIQED